MQMVPKVICIAVIVRREIRQLTVGQMQDLVKGKLKQMGFPDFSPGFSQKVFPNWRAGEPERIKIFLSQKRIIRNRKRPG